MTQENPTPALKPCPNPFCAMPDKQRLRDQTCEPQPGHSATGRQVICGWCNLEGLVGLTDSEAIALWNTRAQPLSAPVDPLAERCNGAEAGRRLADERALKGKPCSLCGKFGHDALSGHSYSPSKHEAQPPIPGKQGEIPESPHMFNPCVTCGEDRGARADGECVLCWAKKYQALQISFDPFRTAAMRLAQEAANLMAHEAQTARERGKTAEGRTVTALGFALAAFEKVKAL